APGARAGAPPTRPRPPRAAQKGGGVRERPRKGRGGGAPVGGPRREAVQGAPVQDAGGRREARRAQDVQRQVTGVPDRQEQPQGGERGQQRVGQELQEPQPGISGASREGFGGEPEPCHHLTSSTAASLVAKMDGWYMGSTSAGLTWKVPGLTIFRR